MRMTGLGGRIRYRSRRQLSRHQAHFVAEYGPASPVRPPVAGSFEHWLTERYCLYAASAAGRRLWRLDIHHRPWPLQAAEATFTRNTMAAAAGLQLDPGPPVLHYAGFQDVRAWAPARLR
jgi:uncharacterized protein YqjF (DUF2071 family)